MSVTSDLPSPEVDARPRPHGAPGTSPAAVPTPARTSLPLAIEVVDLVREFTPRRKAPVRALKGLSLAIPRGEVHGLLGPNGAGKTTLVKILATILLPTSGRAAICGHDVVAESHEVRRLIGVVMGGDRGLYTRLTGRQNLEFWGALHKVPAKALRERSDRLLHRLGLADKADRRVETYSRGMRQRLHLARGLVADAQVLFLDEPTMGMDPVAAREFRTLIGELRGEGRTILLTTHDMAEAEALCDRASFVRDGAVIATNSPQEISGLVSGARAVVVDRPRPRAVDAVSALPGVVSVVVEGEAVRFQVASEEALTQVLRTLVDHGSVSLRTLRPTLEDVYLDLIGARGLEV